MRSITISGSIKVNNTFGVVRSSPVAVPDIFLGFEKPSSAIDRCHSLRSLYLPPAALPSLPLRYVIPFHDKKDLPFGRSFLLHLYEEHPKATALG